MWKITTSVIAAPTFGLTAMLLVRRAVHDKAIKRLWIRPAVNMGNTSRGSHVRQALILLVVISLTVILAHAGISRVLTPWAHASSSRGALVGYWRGEMVFQPGDTRQVVLYVKKFHTLRDILIHGRGDTSGPTPDIEVAARCAGPKAAGAITAPATWRIAGAPASPSGWRRRAVRPAGTRASSKAWNGEDRLEVSARLYTQGEHVATGEAENRRSLRWGVASGRHQLCIATHYV